MIATLRLFSAATASLVLAAVVVPAASAGTVTTLSTRSGGSATFSVTATGAVQKPAAPKPSGKVTISAFGFIEGGALYAHYVHHPTDVMYVVGKTVTLGKVAGACGNLSKNVAALPIKKPKAGVWVVQVDSRKAYRRQVAPYAELSVYVAKKVK